MCEDVENRASLDAEAAVVVDESGDRNRRKQLGPVTPYTNEVGTKLYMSPEQVSLQKMPTHPSVFASALTFLNVTSIPLTLDLMETLDLFSRRACYHRNVSYIKMKRIKVVEKL
jgi:hypothetical protein